MSVPPDALIQMPLDWAFAKREHTVFRVGGLNGLEIRPVRVISRRRLREFWDVRPDAKAPLENWYNTTRRASWRNLVDVRETFRHADPVGSSTVFNIKGNDYRLITRISYTRQRVYVRFVLTHAEYDKDKWKHDCKT